MRNETKVIVIGLDGATWDLIKPWVDEGKLPTFKYLMERGAWGVLESTIPPMSPPAWATIVTGVKPDKHGIWDFYYFENGKLRIINSKNIKSPKIWEILDKYGYKQIIMNVPLTFPVDKINGIFISGMLTPSLESNFVHPLEIKTELLNKNYEIETDPEEGVSKVRWKILEGNSKSIEEIVNKYNKEVENKVKILIEFIRKITPNFVFIVLTSPDRLQHYIINNKGQILKNYVKIDELLKSILSMNYFDQLFIISDHGFSEIKKIFYVNSFLLKDNLIFLNKKAILSQTVIMLLIKLLKKIPKIGLCISKIVSRSKKIGVSKISFDVKKSKCYMYSHTSSGIIVNSSGKEKEAIKERLILKLNNLRDEKNKVLEAIPKERIYTGKYLNKIPDIILKFEKGYTPSEFLVPPLIIKNQNFLLSPNKAPAFKTGDHTSDGILLIYGKNVDNSKIKAKVEDILPTILYLFDIPIPSYLDGKIILSAFTSQFINIHKPKYSHDFKMIQIQKIKKIKDKLKDKLGNGFPKAKK